jgi:hypothetical protein
LPSLEEAVWSSIEISIVSVVDWPEEAPELNITFLVGVISGQDILLDLDLIEISRKELASLISVSLSSPVIVSSSDNTKTSSASCPWLDLEALPLALVA